MDYGIMFTQLLKGSLVTLFVFFFTYVLSIPFGMLVTWGVRQPIKLVRYFLEFYIYIMRGTPLMLQIFFIWYGLPMISSHMTLKNRMIAALVAFTMNYTAYFAEIFRGGLLAIDKGQYEAGTVLGLRRIETMIYIVFPQMFRVVLPSLANETITLMKDTSLVFVIGLGGLLEEAKNLSNSYGSVLPYAFCSLFYLLLTTLPAIFFKRLEHQLDVYE